MAGLFVSYARSDDEAFVEKLQRDLTDRGIPVWWDRKAMESRGLTPRATDVSRARWARRP